MRESLSRARYHLVGHAQAASRARAVRESLARARRLLVGQVRATSRAFAVHKSLAPPPKCERPKAPMPYAKILPDASWLAMCKLLPKPVSYEKALPRRPSASDLPCPCCT